MKSTIAAAAALVGSAAAGGLHHRHAHDMFHNLEKKDYMASTCAPSCTTIYTTITGQPSLHHPSPTSTYVAPSTSTVCVVPTPIPEVCPTAGVYTFSATTLTLTETTTVCGASTTQVPKGTHTLGGVTTVVTTATTVVCPYATTETASGAVTSVIKTTTYVCPSAGTYTIAPITTVVETQCVVPVPVVSTYLPGTYTKPEITTTVTETSTTIYCPFETSKAVPTSYPAVTTSTPAATYQTASVAAYSAAPSSGLGKANPGKPWGFAYTPYTEEGNCKTAAEVESDIAAIAAGGINTIRVYSTDCDTLPNVGSSCAKHGVKMILGIFIDSPGCTAAHPTIAEQIGAIKAWAQYDLVSLISVGNEAVFNGHCTAGQLASLVSQCKSEFVGYTGPYTSAETVGVWQDTSFSSVMCDVVDMVGANAYAFFNTETTASEAGKFVKGQIDIIKKICPGKSAKCLETGWPSEGTALGKAVPGVAEQAEAIVSILEECGSDIILLGFQNDKWKPGNTACGVCEQFWGCKSVVFGGY